jgi:hypothetical protein
MSPQANSPGASLGATYPTLDELLARASEQTGLSDFGPDNFREGFTRFLDSLATDANLTPAGASAVIETLTRRLRNRLDVEAWHAANPAAGAAAVVGPLAVTGLPRTGTTALGNMLSLDPRFRCLRGWEQRQPCPPPVLGREDHDPRRLAAIQASTDLLAARPEQMAMHLWDADATTEDTDVLGIDGHPRRCMAITNGGVNVICALPIRITDVLRSSSSRAVRQIDGCSSHRICRSISTTSWTLTPTPASW